MKPFLPMFHALPPPSDQELSRVRQAADLKVSLLIPARNSGHALEATAVEAHRYLSQHFGSSFEIILIPNSHTGQSADSSLAVAQTLAARFSQIQICTHLGPVGKGAALRSGFLMSRGEIIFFTDADLPYELRFFEEAAELLGAGYDFVTGNRRLSSSHFNIPVKLLPLAYGRHRMGLAFNAAVRLLIPLKTSDTQAGIKALSRRFACEAFQHLSCPGFFFDLELFLVQQAGGYRHRELPVTLFLNSEKSTVKIFRDLFLAGYWLTRITVRNLLGKYRAAIQAPTLLENLDRTESEVSS